MKTEPRVTAGSPLAPRLASAPPLRGAAVLVLVLMTAVGCGGEGQGSSEGQYKRQGPLQGQYIKHYHDSPSAEWMTGAQLGQAVLRSTSGYPSEAEIRGACAALAELPGSASLAHPDIQQGCAEYVYYIVHES